MNKYTFIDEDTIERYDKPYVIIDGKVIVYPTDEQYLKAGLKNLDETIPEEPKYNNKTQLIKLVYVDGDVITRDCKVKEIESELKEGEDGNETIND